VQRVPGAPRRLWRWVRGSTVALGWSAPISGGAPTDYIVEAGLSPGATDYTVAVAQTWLVVPNVGPGRYNVRVRARNANGVSNPSNEVAVSVGCSSMPRQPRGLTSSTKGATVAFTWVDDDGCNDTSYRVGIGTAPGVTDLAVVPSELDSLTGNAPAGTYYARVVTVGPFGMTTPSNEVSVVVGAACTPPSFPTSLEVQLTGQQVTLLWTPANEAAAVAADDAAPIVYVLEVGSQPDAADFGTFLMGRATGLSTVAPPGTYYVRVRPADVCGLGAASNEFVVQVR
jgi:predicted phage tail protein